MNKNIRYDVIVAGGGTSGVVAAVAAAEEGRSVLLVEAQGELGGTGINGGVNHRLGGRSVDCTRFVVGGLFKRFTEEATAEGIALMPPACPDSYSPFGWFKNSTLNAGIPFDRWRMSEFLDRKCLEAGVELLFLTRVVDCKVEDGRLVSITVHNKGGMTELFADQFIDATGDADLAAMAGVPTLLGRDGDHGMAPATLEFHLENVDEKAYSDYVHRTDSCRMLKEIEELRAKGIWKFPYERFICVRMPQEGVFMINTSRLTDVNGIDGWSVSDAMVRGRREVFELIDILRKHFPGFANARLRFIATMPGIRETRRIEGEFTLTVDDLMNDVDFEDTIGFSCYGWDLPDPKRPSFQPMEKRRIRSVTPIPFRIMRPKGVSNLSCPGRSVSVERDVLGPIRVMAPCMAMGEAAGTYAAHPDVSYTELREILRARGCVVDI